MRKPVNYEFPHEALRLLDARSRRWQSRRRWRLACLVGWVLLGALLGWLLLAYGAFFCPEALP